MSAIHDGKTIHAYPANSLATYEVRKNQIFGYRQAMQPLFEIHDNLIYPFPRTTLPVYEIRQGRFIHAYRQASQPLFEFR